jgi:hypothetical protein
MTNYEGSITQEVLEYIQKNPGVMRKKIVADLSLYDKPRVVSMILHRLGKLNAIENRGGRTSSAIWYPVDSTTELFYQDVAEELLSELKDIHHANRVEYLAKRLEEIFG